MSSKATGEPFKVNPIFFRARWEGHIPVTVTEDDLGKKQQATPHLDKVDK